jgi:hypothetical protein
MTRNLLTYWLHVEKPHDPCGTAVLIVVTEK